MTNSFLPQGYKVPSANDGYMKLEQGDNTFRILSSKPILGEEWWVTLPDGKRSPKRVPTGTNIQIKDVEGDIKHFWAFVVYNRTSNKVQVLQITQKSIMRALEDLLGNAYWGHPTGYDININKKGEKLEAKYTVMPLPKTEDGIEESVKDMASKVKLKALFSGEDPFAFDEQAEAEPTKEDVIDPDDLPF